MPNQIGQASGTVDLVQKLVTWLVGSCGWTQAMNQADGNNWRAHLHKGGTYLHLRGSVDDGAAFGNQWNGYNSLPSNNVGLYLSTSFSSALSWKRQDTGAPIFNDVYPCIASINLGPGPYISHQFFDDGAGNYAVVVERTPGVFRLLLWGDSLDKTGAGSWTGGMFFSGDSNAVVPGDVYDDGSGWGTAHVPFHAYSLQSYSAAYVRADVDTWIGKWISLGNTVQTWSTGRRGVNGVDPAQGSMNEVPHFGDGSTTLKPAAYNQQDAQALLLPVPIFAERDNGGWSFLGTLPHVRATPAYDRGIGAGVDVPVGAETWRHFPGFAIRLVD